MRGRPASRLLVALSIVGCETAVTPPFDAGRDVSFGVLPVLSGSLGCIGSATAPAADAPVDQSLRVIPFGSATPLVDVDVWLFPRDRVAPACAIADCLDLRIDTSASVAVTLAGGGWFAVRHFADDAEFLPGIDVHRRAAPAPEFVGLSAVARGTVEVAAGILRPTLEVDFERAVIGFRVVDCDREPVAGAVVRLFVGTEEIVDGIDRALIGYFDVDEVPERDARYTSESGLGGMLNIPVPTSLAPARLEAWGVVSSGAPPTRIACETLPLERGTFSNTELGPLRSDYAADDECP